MKKSDIISTIFIKTGVDKTDIEETIKCFMEEIKNSLQKGENVYLRRFGSFVIKKRARKVGRNISKNTSIEIPEHNIPAFKPSKFFSKLVKENVPIKEK